MGRTRVHGVRATQGAYQKYGTPGLDAHTAPAGPFRHTFNPYVSPFAAHAKILHFNGDVMQRRPISTSLLVAAMASRRA